MPTFADEVLTFVAERTKLVGADWTPTGAGAGLAVGAADGVRVCVLLEHDARKSALTSNNAERFIVLLVSIPAEQLAGRLGERAFDCGCKRPAVWLPRRQIFHNVGVRTTSSQRVRVGAERDGRLVAIAHEATMHTNPQEEFVEASALATHSFYAAPNRVTRQRLIRLNMLRGEDVPSPGEAPGLLALESAMDELAHALGMDPIELRIRNEPTVDCFTPVRSPESNGVSEAFVKTLKRDYARVQPRPDALTVLQRVPARIEDYNESHPHSGLRMRSPRECLRTGGPTGTPLKTHR